MLEILKTSAEVALPADMMRTTEISFWDILIYLISDKLQITLPENHLLVWLFEVLPDRGVDDEVDGGVDDEEEVVEAGEAEVGVGRHEVGAGDQEVHPDPDM